MFIPESQDNNSFELSNFDKLKLESMEIGDSVDGESGDFRVLRYKSGYMLFIFSESLLRITNSTFKEFISLKLLIQFLEHH